MASQKWVICRLCLKVEDNLDEFKAIEDDTKGILNIAVLHKMDFSAIQNPMMCTNCADTLMKCFDFKSKCINSHEYIAPYINEKDDVKLDLVDLFKRKNESVTDVLEVQDVCGLCMSLLKNCSVRSVDSEGDVALKKMIEQCLPELDMNIIKKPVICLPCHGTLENFFRFLTNHLIVEEKIKKYRQTNDIDSNVGMGQSRLLQLAITDVTGCVGGGSLSKVENQVYDQIENTDDTGISNVGDVFKSEPVFSNESEHSEEEVELKSESFMDADELKFSSEERFTPKDMLPCKEDAIKMEEPFCGESSLKEENLIKMEDQKFVLHEEVEIKTDEDDFNRFEDGVLPQLEAITRLHRKQKSLMPYLENDQSKPYSKLTDENLLHPNPLELTMYECDFCLYQSERKDMLEEHYSLNHKDPSEVARYKCDSCSYQTNVKKNLKAHVLKHKDPSEVTMYKCNSCLYQTKRKPSLNNHLLKHKDPSEVRMFKCDNCLYQTKLKDKLKRHNMLKHMVPSEVTRYKCECCSFQTIFKENLRRHFLMHKDPSEVTIYKCDSCLYQTKRKSTLKSHLQKHKDPSEVTMYKCNDCLYQTKYNSSINRHLLTHKDPSEVTMFKCDTCSFQTKRKLSYNRHLLRHKDPSEVKDIREENAV